MFTSTDTTATAHVPPDQNGAFGKIAEMSRIPASCSIRYPEGTDVTTMGSSVFECAAKAIHWIEVEREMFGTATTLADNEVLEISAGMSKRPTHRVTVGRVKAWMRSECLSTSFQTLKLAADRGDCLSSSSKGQR